MHLACASSTATFCLNMFDVIPLQRLPIWITVMRCSLKKSVRYYSINVNLPFQECILGFFEDSSSFLTPYSTREDKLHSVRGREFSNIGSSNFGYAKNVQSIVA